MLTILDPGLESLVAFLLSQVSPPARILLAGTELGALQNALQEKGYEVLTSDLSKLDSDLWQAPYDAVLVADALEKHPDPERVLAILQHHRDQFGKLLLAVPNATYLDNILALVQDRFESTNRRFFTRESLIRLAEAFGFRLLRHQPQLGIISPMGFARHSEGIAPELIQEILANNPNAYTSRHHFAFHYAPDAPTVDFAPLQANLLSVVVRTIDGRRSYLDKTLFSLFTQDYAPLEITVVYQGVQQASLQEIEDLIQRYRQMGLTVHFIQNPTQLDERAKNLNLGVMQSRGQYIAFLDDDDIVYPEHYAEMIETLKQTGRIWGYSDVCRVEGLSEGIEDYYISARNYPFRRFEYDYREHYRHNFIPIHSFVADRARLPEGFFQFDERLNRHEDYDLILHLASQFPPAVSPKATCEYRIRTDGSNSVMDGTWDDELWQEKQKIWDIANALIDHKKTCLSPSAWMPLLWEYIQELQQDRDRMQESLRFYREGKRFAVVEKINRQIKRLPWIHQWGKEVLRFSSNILKSLRR